MPRTGCHVTEGRGECRGWNSGDGEMRVGGKKIKGKVGKEKKKKERTKVPSLRRVTNECTAGDGVTEVGFFLFKKGKYNQECNGKLSTLSTGVIIID